MDSSFYLKMTANSSETAPGCQARERKRKTAENLCVGGLARVATSGGYFFSGRIFGVSATIRARGASAKPDKEKAAESTSRRLGGTLWPAASYFFAGRIFGISATIFAMASAFSSPLRKA